MPERRPSNPFWLGLAVLAMAALPASLPAQGVAPAHEVTLADLTRTITEETVHDHLYFLASDGLRGRDTPSPGLEAAAAYLVSRHRGYGLEPAGEDGTYYQRFPFRLVGPDVAATDLAFGGANGEVRISHGEDAFVRGGSEDALDGPLAFVGTAEGVAPEAGSLEGRVVLFRTPGEWGQALWSAANRQARFARESGAKAVVHVLDADFPGDAVAQLASALAEPGWQLGEAGLFPQIFVREGVVEEGLAGSRPAWGELRERAGRGGSEAVDGVELRGRIPLDVLDDARPPNVLAKVPGSDPELRDEYIVLSAHFDHVGVGQPMDGDSIYNGADDNGSGTTALLEVARVLAALPEAERPRRSVVFAHVSAEEKGLLGSQWWVENPTLPIENVVANINADMVGGDPHPDTVVVLGKEYSSLGPLVNEVNDAMPELNLATAPDLWPEERLFFRSDQYNFMRKEIPSVFLFTGLHECYHRPCDTVEFVNHDKLARITRLIAHSVMEIANRDERPEWDPEGLAEVREMVAGGR